MIVSRQNQKVKDIRRLLRCKGDRAILEGPHLIREALQAGLGLEYALATPDFLASKTGQELLSNSQLEVAEAEPRLLQELCDADSPRGILAIASLPRPSLESIPVVDNGLYVVVDGIQDPGNLGALVRTAEAFSAAAVVLTPGTAHPNHPRALRASAGSLLRASVAMGVEVADLARHLERVSPTWLALTPADGESISDLDLSGSIVLAVGAEGPGLSAGVHTQADRHLTIRLTPPVESLNSTVAASIALYEISRSRSTG